MSLLKVNSAVGVMLLVSGTAGVAQQAAATAGQTAHNQAATARAGNTKSVIRGTAVDNGLAPVPKATVRLRNLATNKIEQVVSANSAGEFVFEARPDVPYVVEVADQAGRIIAVGDVITAQSGEVAGALVAIPARLPGAASIFSDSLASVLSAAIGTGVTVVDVTRLPPLSPTR